MSTPRERAAAMAGLTWPERCVCGVVPDPPLRCSGCRAVNYCSPKCQRADWPEHQLRCNHLRASHYDGMREIEAGKIIYANDFLPGAVCDTLLPEHGPELLATLERVRTMRNASDRKKFAGLDIPEIVRVIVQAQDVERFSYLMDAAPPAFGLTPLLRSHADGDTLLSLASRSCTHRWAAFERQQKQERAYEIWRLLLDATALSACEDWRCVSYTTYGYDRREIDISMPMLTYVAAHFPRELAERATRALIAKGANVNAVHFMKASSSAKAPLQPCCALHVAIDVGTAGVVRALLEAGADPCGPGGRRNEFLHRCARVEVADAAEKVRLLVHYGVDIDAAQSVGATPLALSAAAAVGSLRAFDTLVDLGASVRSIMDPLPVDISFMTRGANPPLGAMCALHAAALDHNDAILRRLLLRPELAAQLDVNVRATAPRAPLSPYHLATPLHLAVAFLSGHNTTTVSKLSRRDARARQLNSLRVLIRAGADLSARTGSGHTPLLMALAMVRVDAVCVIFKAGEIRERPVHFRSDVTALSNMMLRNAQILFAAADRPDARMPDSGSDDRTVSQYLADAQRMVAKVNEYYQLREQCWQRV